MKLKLERCPSYIAKNANRWGAWDLYMHGLKQGFLYGYPREIWYSLQRSVHGMDAKQVQAAHNSEQYEA